MLQASPVTYDHDFAYLDPRLLTASYSLLKTYRRDGVTYVAATNALVAREQQADVGTLRLLRRHPT